MVGQEFPAAVELPGGAAARGSTLVRCHKCELKTPSTILTATKTSNVTAMRRKLCWNFGISSTEANVRGGHSLQDAKQNRLTAIANKAVLAITQAFFPLDASSAPGKSSKPIPVSPMNAAPLKTFQRAPAARCAMNSSNWRELLKKDRAR